MEKTRRRFSLSSRKVLSLIFAVGLISSLCYTVNTAAESAKFKIADAVITSKTDGVDADISSFDDANVITDVTFHNVGETVVYKISITNTDTEDHLINSIIDDNKHSAIAYSYDEHKNYKVATGESFDFVLTAKYAIATQDSLVALNTKFTIRFDGTEENIGIGPRTNDDVNASVVVAIISAAGLLVCILFGAKNRKKATKIAAFAICVSALILPISASALAPKTNDFILKATYHFSSNVANNVIGISVSDEDEWKPAKIIAIDYTASGNGIKNQYSTDNGTTWIDYGGPFTVAVNNTKILARTIDLEDNIIVSAEKLATKIDPVTPTVSISLAGSYYSGQALDLSTVTSYTAGESGATLRWFIGDVELHNLSDSYLIDRLEEQYEVEVRAVATSGAGLSADDYSETIIIKYARWNDYLIGPLTRDNIGNIKFVSWAQMPGNENNRTDISVNQDGAVMEYYELNSETNLYDVYIASPYGYSRYKTDSMGSNLAYSTGSNTSHTTSSSTGGAGTCQDGNYGLFAYMPNLKTIDFAYLDMFNINDMSCMFTGIDFTTEFWDANSNLTSINWGEKFNTENVTNMSFAFAGLTKLQSLDLSSFDMGSVESIEGIFARNETLETLELADWDTSKITTMNYAFYETPNLKNYNVEGWKTSSLVSMRGMFYGSGIESLDLSGWDTSHVNSFYQLFEKTPNLHYVNMKGLNTSSVVDMAYMFERSGVYELDLSSFNTANVTNMDSMFYSANQLKTLDLQSFNTAQVTNMDYMFGNMTNLESINLDSFDTSSVTILRAAFYNDKKLKTVNFRHLDMSSMSDARYMFYNTSSLENVFVEKTPTVKSGANLGYMWYASHTNKYTIKEYEN